MLRVRKYTGELPSGTYMTIESKDGWGRASTLNDSGEPSLSGGMFWYHLLLKSRAKRIMSGGLQALYPLIYF